jgi:hypothetical protein
MSKFPILIATAASLVCLSSCIPPEVPPPRFQPNPPYAPQPVDPYGAQNDVSPPPPPSQPAPPPATATGGYPTATRTANPDQVISPYEPYNVIDITGPPRIEPGKLARDPSNGKIFRVP